MRHHPLRLLGFDGLFIVYWISSCTHTVRFDRSLRELYVVFKFMQKNGEAMVP